MKLVSFITFILGQGKTNKTFAKRLKACLQERCGNKVWVDARRIGDLMVLGDKTTVFRNLKKIELEGLDKIYRSDSSLYEKHVPLFVITKTLSL